MSAPSQRIVLTDLIKHGPSTVPEITERTGLASANVANVCSTMASFNALGETRHRGSANPRKYTAQIDMLPRDEDVILDLVDAYGAKAVRAAVKRVVDS